MRREDKRPGSVVRAGLGPIWDEAATWGRPLRRHGLWVRSTNRLGLAVLFVLVVAACGERDKASTGAPPFGFTDWIAVEMDEWAIPGASVAVIEDYEVVWAEGFGLADRATGEHVTADTRFQAASVSKPIAAIAAVMAYDEFGLSLDDDVNEVLVRWWRRCRRDGQRRAGRHVRPRLVDHLSAGRGREGRRRSRLGLIPARSARPLTTLNPARSSRGQPPPSTLARRLSTWRPVDCGPVRRRRGGG